MNSIEYTFKLNNQVHVLQTKPSANTKLGAGYITATYHFAIEQVVNNNLKLDANTCFDCKYSYNQNNNKTGGCYTHSGLQSLGLRAMLNRLNKIYHKGTIKEYDKDSFNSFVQASKLINPVLVRAGAYGEPTTLPLNLIGKLTRLSPKHTGYTSQWNKPQVQGYSKYLMASTHSKFESSVANSLGFRSFESSKQKESKMAVCPASKEFGKKKTCIECAACNGTINKKTNNIHIKTH